mmetsp:Transcript_12675/g.37362  ORF Transcript_12675/g.37362 Transcript_12675/m.37362 type:complete len:324 (-) Transcript_12675:2305-3276(-)
MSCSGASSSSSCMPVTPVTVVETSAASISARMASASCCARSFSSKPGKALRSHQITAGTGESFDSETGMCADEPTMTGPNSRCSSRSRTAGAMASSERGSWTRFPYRTSASIVASILAGASMSASTATSSTSPAGTTPLIGSSLTPTGRLSGLKLNAAGLCPAFFSTVTLCCAVPMAMVPKAIVFSTGASRASTSPGARQSSVVDSPFSTEQTSACSGWQPSWGSNSTLSGRRPLGGTTPSLGSTEYGDLPVKSRGWPQRKVAGCVPRFCKTSDCEQLDAASPAPKENSSSSSGVPRALTRCSSSGTTCAVTVIRNAWMPLIT